MENNYKIIQNLFPVSLINEIKETIDHKDFSWYFSDSIYTQKVKFDIKNNFITISPGLTHIVYDEGIRSNIFNLLRSILYFLEKNEDFTISTIHRIRIRRTLPYPNHTEHKFNAPHIDLEQISQYLTFVYYVDDSDGDTILFKYTKDSMSQKYSEINNFTEKDVLIRIPPKKGNGILFNGQMYHSGNCPVKYTHRTIINFDFSVY